MRVTDLPEVMLIERRSFSAPWEETTFRGLLRRPTATLLVVERAGEVEGYAVLWFAADEAELGDLAVHPECRRRGTARLLLDECLDEAGRRGARGLFLEVRAGNTAALRLYESAGFRVAGVRKRYYTSPVEDAVLMRLEMDSAAR